MADVPMRDVPIGDSKLNVEDMISKGRRKSAAMWGSQNHLSVLTEDQVIEILRRIGHGEPTSSLAKEFHVHRDTVWHIKSNKSWRHIER
jgi:DNA invertase Pin-like site-specific DNA recombinase